MSSKRQFGHHDDAVDAKRQHLDLASTGVHGAPVAPGSRQPGNWNDIGRVILQSHHIQHSGATMDRTESTDDSSTTHGEQDDEWDIDRTDAMSLSSEPTASQLICFGNHPPYLEDGIEYWNAQHYDLGEGPRYLTHLVGMNESEILAKRLSDTVEDVLTSLDHGMPTVPVSALEMSDLMTSLKGHQEAALLFIQQRENPEYCQKVNRELRFHMRISLEDAVSSMAMGGILADAMGLGKTLTMLTSISSTRLAASDFQNRDTDVEAGQATHHRTSATLVVVTSTQVMEVWRNEVSRHFRDGSLQVLTFHGESRPTSSSAMMGHDIVLTTFATLVADYKRGKVLQNVEWFRVVLDEAHWIRNQSSQQFKAAKRLITERRWCLSGTPIQNSINDLVSLLRFLRFESFSRMAVFQRYILEPLSKDTFERAKPLQMLLRGMCLRRTEKYLNLPWADYKHIRLSLDHDERAVYADVLRKYRRKLDELVSTQAKTNRCTVLFAMMTELRRICNHGTLQVPIPGLQSPRTLTKAGTDSLCDYCNEAEESMAKLNGDSVCPECHRSLSESDASTTSTWDGSPLILHSGLSTKLESVADKICSLQEVHIVEPQWNPSVEEQAIARALRMGQTKTVTVFRYMMENTVEENILALQKKKGNLAKFTMDGNSGDGVSGTLEDLKFILDIDTV
ncbi:DNA repair rad5 [Fusarium albosuccineum]|uniref:DNA repair rad5 n=1 Tax=Fusarium albosuccineum TaxID=1237068 RepID=A0A8H4PDJ0_9HYPO|nr:DNA repair rad5 [Fusarium albosuccineum]